MRTKQQADFLCQICGQHKRRDEVLPGAMVRAPVLETIREEHPGWSPSGYICLEDLNRYRTRHVERVLEAQKGEVSTLEAEVVQSLQEQELLSRNLNQEFDRNLTLGERVADKVAEFGGSWRFILLFGAVLLLWIVINSSVLLLRRPFDPYPFILLNLLLSCLAAIQAPVIMMSQNRQEAKDRLRAEQDYRVNLKAELEIRSLSAKMDELLAHQWQRLLEIQEIQMEMMEEMVGKGRSAPDSK